MSYCVSLEVMIVITVISDSSKLSVPFPLGQFGRVPLWMRSELANQTRQPDLLHTIMQPITITRASSCGFLSSRALPSQTSRVENRSNLEFNLALVFKSTGNYCGRTCTQQLQPRPSQWHSSSVLLARTGQLGFSCYIV